MNAGGVLCGIAGLSLSRDDRGHGGEFGYSDGGGGVLSIYWYKYVCAIYTESCASLCT